MPELAEVAYACSVWGKGVGEKTDEVLVHPTSRVYRDLNRAVFIKALSDVVLEDARCHGKQMLFRFSNSRWLGLHLGMTGSLSVKSIDYQPAKFDALVLRQSMRCLVFSDPRQFGRLRLHLENDLPRWWTQLPLSMLDPKFDLQILVDALRKHAKRPIKALLLDQRYFQGMGNWMADEVLWRARIHPAHPCGLLKSRKRSKLFEKILFVAYEAMRTIGRHGKDPPSGWLFHVRWQDGGLCPETGKPLRRETIGGRTSCWSPTLQRKPRL